MNSVAIDIKDILVAEAGFVFKTDLVISKQPNTPNNICTIFDTSSAPTNKTLGGITYYMESIQILIRDESYITAHSQAQKIMDALDGKANFLWDDTFYLSIDLMNGPNQLMSGLTGDSNPKGLTQLSLNFNIQRTKTII